MTVGLRNYQVEALAAIRARAAGGIRRQLVALPTGTGKTIVFSHLPRALGLPGRVLVLAHREELLDQARQMLALANPDRTVAIEQAERRADGADVVVASVQTLRGGRLQVLDSEALALVIVDEAHHAIAPSYRAVLDHLRAGEEAGPLLVGFTATPRRGDGVGLAEVFQEIVYQRSLRDMIAAGWCCRIRAWRIRTGTDLTAVRTRHGDFAEGELAAAVDTGDRNALVVRSYQARAAGRRALVFAVDVNHAEHLAEAFRAAGLKADSVSGRLPREERRARVAAFRAGQLQILTNCLLLTEGFDCPDLAAIVMARPTQSPLLYAQMVGRGTRPAPGKADLVVLDVVDNTRRHSLVTAPTLFGLPAAFDLQGHDVLQVVDEMEAAPAHVAGLLGRALSVDQVRRVLQEVDPFAVPEIPEAARRVSRFAWFALGDALHLDLGRRERLVIVPDLLDRWRLARRAEDAESVLGIFGTQDEALVAADAWCRRERGDRLGLLEAGARWRGEAATAKQLRLLARLGIPAAADTTKGQAALLIAGSFAGRREGRASSPACRERRSRRRRERDSGRRVPSEKHRRWPAARPVGPRVPPVTRPN